MLAKSLFCGLVILLISTKAAAQNITSIDSYCLNLLRGNESVLIGPGERISGETINSKFFITDNKFVHILAFFYKIRWTGLAHASASLCEFSHFLPLSHEEIG